MQIELGSKVDEITVYFVSILTIVHLVFNLAF